MFGMNDPKQTLLQLEGYVKDGRFEMSEVMATQFTDMFLSMKKRDYPTQVMLIRGLQILSDVLVLREKYRKAVTSTKVLLRERRRLVGESESLGQEYVDLHRSAKANALAGKIRKAKSLFVKAFKKSGGCLSPSIDAMDLIPGDKKLGKIFISCVENSGPVIKTGGIYCLIPEGLQAVDAKQVLAILGNEMFKENQHAVVQHQRVSSQITAIEQGEMVANSRLQKALDSLQPKHDYYEYS